MDKILKKYLYIPYIFVFYAIIRFPLHQLTGLQDSAGRVYSSLLFVNLMIIIYDYFLRKQFFKMPMGIWLVWIGYASINTLIQGMNFDMKIWQFFTWFFAPLVLMYFISLEPKQMLKVITISAYFSMLIIFFYEEKEYYEGEGFRLGMQMNANELGINAALTVMLLFILRNTKKIKTIYFLLLAFLPVYIVISTGSRSALIALFMVVGLSFLVYRSKNIIKTISVIFFGIILSIISISLLEEYSLGYKRLQITRAEGETIVKTGTLLDNLGSRGIYYVLGWEIFVDHPVFGVGLGNYKYHNRYSNQPNHVEIMIQLSELGIIGFLLFAIFNIWIFGSLFRIWKRVKEIRLLRIETETYMAALLTIFGLFFTTYTHWHLIVFATYGLIIGHIYRLNNEFNGRVLRY